MIFAIIAVCLLIICFVTAVGILTASIIKTNKLMKNNTPFDFYKKRSKEKDFCNIEEIPEELSLILMEMEDDRFLTHKGVDWIAVKDSFIHNLKYSNKVGASTITQQLCKNLYFSFESSYMRKIIEIIMALRTEKILTKEQILELYMNIIYYDNGQYGIVNAAEFYFGKKVSELTFNEAFFLAVLLPVVGIYNPLRVPEQFCVYRNNKARIRWMCDFITGNELKSIINHTPDNLDEDMIIHTPEEYEKYVRGPMINERFGVESEWQKNSVQ